MRRLLDFCGWKGETCWVAPWVAPPPTAPRKPLKRLDPNLLYANEREVE
jgi:hypothetical protein